MHGPLPGHMFCYTSRYVTFWLLYFGRSLVYQRKRSNQMQLWPIITGTAYTVMDCVFFFLLLH